MGAAGRMTSGRLRPLGSRVAAPFLTQSPNSCMNPEFALRKDRPFGTEQAMGDDVFAGIDVSKAFLDVAVRPDGICQNSVLGPVLNHRNGIQHWHPENENTGMYGRVRY